MTLPRGMRYGALRGRCIDPGRLAAFDRLCDAMGAPRFESLDKKPTKTYRDNFLPRSHFARFKELEDAFSLNYRAMNRCAIIAVAANITRRIPDMAELGYFPIGRIKHLRDDRSDPAWRRFALLCEEFGSSWDDYERGQDGQTLAYFTPSEHAEVKRAADTYGVATARICILGVVHLIRTWEKMENGEEAQEPEVEC